MSWLYNMMWSSAAVFVVVAAMLYVHQGRLLYFPSMPIKDPDDNPKGYRNPGEYGLPYEDMFMVTKDGVKIHGWLLQQRMSQSVPTIVYFHGNAGNIGFRLPSAKDMFEKLLCNVFMVEYRGYGKSEGTPTEEGLQLDAEAALRALRESPLSRVDTSRVIVFGRSLGGAVAFAAAELYPEWVQAVVVENTFLSIGHMVDVVLPPLKMFKSTLLNIDWPNEQRAQKIRQPILFISGSQDELVPPWHMARLHKLATSATFTTMVHIEDGTHNDTWLVGGDKYYAEMSKFIAAAFRGGLWTGVLSSVVKENGRGSSGEVEGPGKVVDAVPSAAIPIMPSLLQPGKKKNE